MSNLPKRFFRLKVVTIAMKDELQKYVNKHYVGELEGYNPPVIGYEFIVYIPSVEAANDVMPLIVKYGEVSHLAKVRDVCAAAGAAMPAVPLTMGSDIKWLEFTGSQTATVLRRRNIQTVADLIRAPKRAFEGMSRSMEDVRSRLAAYDLKLKADE